MSTNYLDSALQFGRYWQYLPKGVNALLIFLLGLCAAVIAGYLITKVLERVGFNSLCDRSGLSEILRKGEVRYSPARLVGASTYWILLLVGLLWAFHLIGIDVTTMLFTRAKAVLPALLSATAILVVGYAIVAFLANVIRTIAINAALPYAHLISRIIKWVGVFFVFVMSIEQLGIATHIVTAVFLIVLGSTAFGLTLAFGLGCKDMAHEAMMKLLHHIKERRRNAKSDFEG